MTQSLSPRLTPIYRAASMAMTALWCFVGYRLVQNPVIGTQVRRYGRIALPLVLSVWILSGARGARVAPVAVATGEA